MRPGALGAAAGGAAAGGGGRAAGSPPGGADGQPWEGAKVKFRLPDLPPGKHATIQLERQPVVPVGHGQGAGSQREALGSILNRLEGVMRKVTDQPPADSSLREELAPPKQNLEPGSLGALYQKLKMIRDNMDSSLTSKEEAEGSLASALDRGTQLDEPVDPDAEPKVTQTQNGPGETVDAEASEE